MERPAVIQLHIFISIFARGDESFNQCIWKKAPKDTFVSRRTLEVAVASGCH